MWIAILASKYSQGWLILSSIEHKWFVAALEVTVEKRWNTKCFLVVEEYVLIILSAKKHFRTHKRQIDSSSYIEFVASEFK